MCGLRREVWAGSPLASAWQVSEQPPHGVLCLLQRDGSPRSISGLWPTHPWHLLAFWLGLLVLSLYITQLWSSKSFLEQGRINRTLLQSFSFCSVHVFGRQKAIFSSLIICMCCFQLCGRVFVSCLLCFSLSLLSLVQIPQSSGLFWIFGGH